MISSVEIENLTHDTSINFYMLDHWKYPESGIIQSIDGLGPVKSNVTTTHNAGFDGGYVASKYRNTRTITLKVVSPHPHPYVDDEGVRQFFDVEDFRYQVYEICATNSEVNLYISYKDSKKRRMTTGVVESCEPTIFSDLVMFTISIVCGDPNFYDEKATTLTYTNDIGGTMDCEILVIYGGDIDVGMDIRIDVPTNYMEGNAVVGRFDVISQQGQLKPVKTGSTDYDYIDNYQKYVFVGDGKAYNVYLNFGQSTNTSIPAKSIMALNTIPGQKEVTIYTATTKQTSTGTESKTAEENYIDGTNGINSFKALEVSKTTIEWPFLTKGPQKVKLVFNHDETYGVILSSAVVYPIVFTINYRTGYTGA